MSACKCRWCQANITTKVATMDVIDGKKMFFCNEEHRDEFLKKRQAEQERKEKAEQLKDKFYTLFCDILGVKGITNTALWKEKSEINKVYSDDVIIAYIEENKDYLRNAVSRLHGNEYGKIRYVSVVLRNKLGDYKPKVEEKPRPKMTMTFYEPAQTHNNRRRSLSDLEDEL